jgi:hypothetical protein
MPSIKTNTGRYSLPSIFFQHAVVESRPHQKIDEPNDKSILILMTNSSESTKTTPQVNGKHCK